MNKQPLNFNWKFICGFDESYLQTIPADANNIDLPHTVKLMPLNYFDEKEYQGIYSYFKMFDINDFSLENNYIIHFDSFMVEAKIYINDYYLGNYPSLYIPVDIDITKYVKEKDNKLIVVLSTIENSSYPPFSKIVDYLTFGGIYETVSLLSYKNKYIKKVYVDSSIDGHILLKLDSNIEDVNNIHNDVYFNNELINSFDGLESKLSDIKLWDIDNPNLYLLKTIYREDDIYEKYETKFGFRKAIFKNDGFYLNDKKRKIIGVNRHQSYPYIGYAATKSLQIDDADIIKYQIGVDVVRTSHYMQDENFLNRCDEIGLLVIDEIPGWQNINDDKIWKDMHFKNVEMMAKTAFNHPSVISHGVRIDESKDDYSLYLKSNQIAHDIDKARQTLGVRNFKNSQLLEDIYAYNDFSCNSRKHGLDKKKKISKYKKPYLVSEYMGHMYPTKAFDNEQVRLEHALRHAKVLDDYYKYDDISACITWCAFDYNTHKEFGSGDRICYHGLNDIYRNPKYASYIYKSQNENEIVLHVLNNMERGDFKEMFYQEIYVATNCDYIILYRNNKEVKKYYPINNEYKYLKHPPIKIDNVIGPIEDKRFSKNDQNKLSNLLSKLAIYGFSKLTLKDKLNIALLMVKYKLKYDDLVNIFNVYILGDNKNEVIYTFKGYIQNKEVISKSFGPSNKFHLKTKILKSELINDECYDTTKITISLRDQYERVMTYSFLPLNIEVSGPIILLSPSTISLHAGQVSIYIRSINKEGDGKVMIKSSVENIDIDLHVSCK